MSHLTGTAVNVVTTSAAQGIKALGIRVIVRVDVEPVRWHFRRRAPLGHEHVPEAVVRGRASGEPVGHADHGKGTKYTAIVDVCRSHILWPGCGLVKYLRV